MLDYNDALSWIHSIGRFGMNQGLKRIQALLNLLDNPEKKLKFIHIGGTNGKGSTAAFTASILEEAGYQVGLYTSPYLIQFTNRMGVNGKDISPERLTALVEKIKPLVEKVAANPDLGQPTEFEVVTALAFMYFAEEKPDVVVLEVGLGGRLDATNVVNPLACILTTVSLEHTQVLGSTEEAIAREKAAIIKKRAPVITGVSGIAPLEVIREACMDKQVPLFVLGKDFNYTKNNKSDNRLQSFNYLGLKSNINDLQISLLGRHQLANASMALACLEGLSDIFKLKEEDIRQGLAKTVWPGRLEVMRENPLVVLDGAHNVEAMRALEEAIKEEFKYKKLYLILGILADKDIKEMLSPILPLIHTLIITLPDSPRAASPQLVREGVASSFKGRVLAEPIINKAVAKAINLADKDDLIIIAGSLYTISSARAFLKA